ncbi:hypothetical protein DVH24_036730 [Malus domestica]|uniref:Uncharacterized protein n=1 Tax=Malus domestica TaxID=3750 RepID=A0A498IH31_MALDO|nr:hypothetical protein DVH24_036730 [Malus domestica]
MAAGFGATIVPFAAVGEDDLLQLVLDRNALMKIPKLSDHLKDSSRETKRKKEILIKDKEKAKELYLQIQSDLENSLAYLIKKREDDPYGNVFDRIVQRMTYSAIHEVPTFEP